MLPIIGWLTIVFFAPLGILGFARAFVGGVAVRIDREGMFINGHGSDTIPWTDFTWFASGRTYATTYFYFGVKASRRKEFHWLTRFSWALNALLTGHGGWLNMNATNRKHYEFVEALVRCAPSHLTEQLA